MLTLYVNDDKSGSMPLSNYRVDLVSLNYNFPVYTFETNLSEVEVNEAELVSYLKKFKNIPITKLQVINNGESILNQTLTNGVLIVCQLFSGEDPLSKTQFTKYSLIIEDRDTKLPELEVENN